MVNAFRAGLDNGSNKVENSWWEKADRMWWFQRLVRTVSGQDYILFRKLYVSVHGSDGGEALDIPRLFHRYAAQEDNQKLLKELAENDMPENEVEREERMAFSSRDTGAGGMKVNNMKAIAVARKLTLMSEMNEDFIADRRLWLWIEEALKEESLA